MINLKTNIKHTNDNNYLTITQVSTVDSSNPHGMCYHVKTNNYNIIFDGGNTIDVTHTKTYLDSNNIKVIHWFVTHPHYDHINAIMNIITNNSGYSIYVYANIDFDINTFSSIAPQDLTDYANFSSFISLYGYTKVIKGNVFTFDTLTIRVLNTPAPNGVFSVNSDSIMYKLTNTLTNNRFLITGDMDLTAEDQFSTDDLAAEVIQVTHHGVYIYPYYCTDAFYQKIGFTRAFFPCSTNNWNTSNIRFYNSFIKPNVYFERDRGSDIEILF